MYIPVFFYLLILSCSVKVKELITHALFIGSLIAGFLCSYIFYFGKQYPLYNDIYSAYLERVFGTQPQTLYYALTFLYIGAVLIVYIFRKRIVRGKFNRIIKTLNLAAFPCLLLFLVLYSLYLIPGIFSYAQQFTRWVQLDTPFDPLKHLMLYQSVLHVGVFLFLLILLGLAVDWKKYIDTAHPGLLLIALFAPYFLLINSYFNYLFYYNYYQSRYLVSEVIPYTILLAVIIYHYTRENPTLNKIFKVLIGCTIIYYAFFSFIQMGTSEGPDVSFYNNLIKTVGKDSLLLVDKSYRSGSAVTAPLVWYYNLRAFIVDEEILKSPVLANLINKNEKVYLLAPDPTSSLTPNMGEKMRLRYNYLSSNPDCTEHSYSYLPLESQTYYLPKNKLSCFLLPSATFTGYIDLYLFKIK
jgi:hypothetical protein